QRIRIAKRGAEEFEIAFAEDVFLNRAIAQRVDNRFVVAAAEQPFGQATDLKEKHVPTAKHLARIAPQRAAHALEMRTVHDDETIDYLGTHQRGRPCDGAAPIVADYGGALVAKRLDQIGDVADQ